MSGTPTEVFNDDVKELKGEIRENRSKIDLVKDEVHRFAVARAQMQTELRGDIHGIALAQAEMKGEFRLMKLLLTIVILGIAGSIWQFVKLDTRVNGLETRLDKMDSRLDKMDSRLDKMDSRLEKLEDSIAKILEQTKPSLASPTFKGSSPAP